jgi:glycosyltransferase
MNTSIITATYNSGLYLEETIKSIFTQKEDNIEYIIIDGKSTDNTIDIINKYNNSVDLFISEPDQGIYDAINKGIKNSNGDIIGLLHSDDLFTNDNIVNKITHIFNKENIDILYGDLLYVKSTDPNKVIRYWRSQPFYPDLLNKGWMPPHPTLFIKKEVFNKIGLYDTKYKISADYDFIVRLFKYPALKSYYLPEVITRMRVGGDSNKSLKNIIRKSREDYEIIKKYNLKGLYTLFMKNTTKLKQFI